MNDEKRRGTAFVLGALVGAYVLLMLSAVFDKLPPQVAELVSTLACQQDGHTRGEWRDGAIVCIDEIERGAR